MEKFRHFCGGYIKPEQVKRHKIQAQYLSKQLDRCATDISEAINDKLKQSEWQANTARMYTASLALLIKFIQRMAASAKPNTCCMSRKHCNHFSRGWDIGLKVFQS